MEVVARNIMCEYTIITGGLKVTLTKVSHKELLPAIKLWPVIMNVSF